MSSLLFFFFKKKKKEIVNFVKEFTEINEVKAEMIAKKLI